MFVSTNLYSSFGNLPLQAIVTYRQQYRYGQYNQWSQPRFNSRNVHPYRIIRVHHQGVNYINEKCISAAQQTESIELHVHPREQHE